MRPVSCGGVVVGLFVPLITSIVTIPDFRNKTYSLMLNIL